MIAFYLSISVEVPASEKLKLASRTGNELLLVSTLHNQCGKAAAIEEIVDCPNVLNEIEKAPRAPLVMRKMLEHQAKCGKECPPVLYDQWRGQGPGHPGPLLAEPQLLAYMIP